MKVRIVLYFIIFIILLIYIKVKPPQFPEQAWTFFKGLSKEWTFFKGLSKKRPVIIKFHRSIPPRKFRYKPVPDIKTKSIDGKRDIDLDNIFDKYEPGKKSLPKG